MTVTTVPVTLLSRVRASSAVPWNANGEPGIDLETPLNPTSSASRALIPGNTHKEPVAYSRIVSRSASRIPSNYAGIARLGWRFGRMPSGRLVRSGRGRISTRLVG